MGTWVVNWRVKVSLTARYCQVLLIPSSSNLQKVTYTIFYDNVGYPTKGKAAFPRIDADLPPSGLLGRSRRTEVPQPSAAFGRQFLRRTPS